MPTALITGGHGGIGFECAKQLASGYHLNLVLAGRSPKRMAGAAEELRKSFGVKVSLLSLDTSSLASIRQAAHELARRIESGEVDTLQAIICNAGGRFWDLSYSIDGYEQTFATNYLGHFLLVELLVGHLDSMGRVVFTVSGTHDPDTVDGKLVGKAVQPDAIALANDGKNGQKPLSTGKRYSTSKLCMVMCSYELARRLKKSGSSIASIAFDPGSVPDSGFLRAAPAIVQWLAGTAFFKWFSKRIGITPGDLKFSGASLARLAADTAFRDGSGKYFQSNSLRLIELRSAAISYNEQLAWKLWNDSRQLVRLQPGEEPAQLQ